MNVPLIKNRLQAVVYTAFRIFWRHTHGRPPRIKEGVSTTVVVQRSSAHLAKGIFLPSVHFIGTKCVSWGDERCRQEIPSVPHPYATLTPDSHPQDKTRHPPVLLGRQKEGLRNRWGNRPGRERSPTNTTAASSFAPNSDLT